MTEEEIKALIHQELPTILQQDQNLRDFVLRTVENYYAGKQETESRFDRILAEIRRDREEQSRKWEEQSRKWEEQNRKWDENNQQIQQIMLEIKKLNSKHDSTIGALGARWGLYSESSFRNALKGILEDSFAVEVLHLTEYDSAGEVFGRPEQVEFDLLIKNGLLIICEIKSSMSKADIYTFERKVRFYQNRHQQTANRKIVISPMVHPRAKEIASTLEVEVYSYAEELRIEN
ncbi:MAG: DUF3782 domain-containing protein [Symploca sp. SIO1C2]|nr:DUF3782 domain-containing protein [Symploca sp. SIO1C2]